MDLDIKKPGLIPGSFFILRQISTIECAIIFARKGDIMKNMNRVELEQFTQKYFKEYNNDIRRVSYIIHDGRIEYLINGWYLFAINL